MNTPKTFEPVVPMPEPAVAFDAVSHAFMFADGIRITGDKAFFYTAAQLRAYAAEVARACVAKRTAPDSYHSNERARARVWNACRAATLSAIDKWEKSV